MAAPRSVTPLIARIRNFLIQRKYNEALRFEDLNVSKRDQPPPNIPGGPSHKLANNYYVSRDGRKEAMPPTKVYDASQPRLEAGSSSESSTNKVPVKAGFGYDWTTGKAQYS